MSDLDTALMDKQQGAMYARMLEKGVAVVDVTTGLPQWADPSAAMMKQIADWIAAHKAPTTDLNNPIEKILERERERQRKMPPVSTEPDAASN